MAEINLFLLFLGSIGFDLLIGDPRFLIHPVQVIGVYIKKISDYLIKNFVEECNKNKPLMTKLREENSKHEIEKVGKGLRSMFSWLK